MGKGVETIAEDAPARAKNTPTRTGKAIQGDLNLYQYQIMGQLNRGQIHNWWRARKLPSYSRP